MSASCLYSLFQKIKETYFIITIYDYNCLKIIPRNSMSTDVNDSINSIPNLNIYCISIYDCYNFPVMRYDH